MMYNRKYCFITFAFSFNAHTYRYASTGLYCEADLLLSRADKEPLVYTKVTRVEAKRRGSSSTWKRLPWPLKER